MAVRAALGASSWRMIRQVLTESLAIALAGGALGLLLAYGAVRGLVAWAPVDVPRLDEVHLDWRAVLFALGLPRWPAYFVRADSGMARVAIRATGRASIGRTQRHRGPAWFEDFGIAGERRSRAERGPAGGRRIADRKPGPRAQHRPGFSCRQRVDGDDQPIVSQISRRQSDNEMLERLIPRSPAIAGREEAAIITALPLQGETWVDMITREDDHRPVFQRPAANYRFTSPDYFTAMGIPIVRGSSSGKARRMP